ncbi:MAG: hypothetical protein R3C20_14155 [Planctomycetaceae bacterium]
MKSVLVLMSLMLPWQSVWADDTDLLAACQRYLVAGGNPDLLTRETMEVLDTPDRDPVVVNKIVDRLSRSEPVDRQAVTGVMANQSFRHPDLMDRHTGDLLHFYVPQSYKPSQPFGLVIFMHGGGGQTPPEHALHIVTHPDDDPQSIGLQPYLADRPFILAAPSAPVNKNTGARWNVQGADESIADVIRECRFRFNIDGDRVFLGGYSMGGFGAYHLCQRLSDQLAGGFVFSGAWKTMRWQAWTGLPLFLRHGVYDAAPAKQNETAGRPRFTDVFYARAATQRLSELGLPHEYVEDEGNHAIRGAKVAMSRFADWIVTPRRDPFAKRVVAISPRGWNADSDAPSPHCRWITIHKSGDGTIEFDQVQITGPRPAFGESSEDFHKQSFHLSRRAVKAGLVDARIASDNHLVVETQNVRRFSVWLHPAMVDFSRPVNVSVNGQQSQHRIDCRLSTVLESYQRRKDWGLIYQAKVTLTVPSEE